MSSSTQRATYADVFSGRPANGLVWVLEGGIDCHHAPTDDSFDTRDGVRFLRSPSLARKKSRQKDRARSWFLPVYENQEYAETEEGEFDVFTWKTPVGVAVGRRHENHFTEYPVKTVADLDIWTYVHENLRFRPNDEWVERYQPAQLTSFGLSWSPVQQLMQFDLGLENFYYFLMDAPEKMTRLIAAMQERCVERLSLGLSLFPKTESVYWGENTSSSSISPPYYRQHTLPHIRRYADMVHEHGARLVVHMCGLLKDLLDAFAETGMDGIHSVTPPPIGDAPYRLLRDRFGADFAIIGRFNAQLWAGKSKSEIQANLKEHIWRELLDTPFALLVTTDCMPDISYDNVMTLADALENLEW